MASQKKVFVEVPAYALLEVPATAIQGLLNAEVWERDYRNDCYYLSKKGVQVQVVDAERCINTYKPEEEK